MPDFKVEVVLTTHTQIVIVADDADDARAKIESMDFSLARQHLQHIGAIEQTS